jgi:hypothetical protein
VTSADSAEAASAACHLPIAYWWWWWIVPACSPFPLYFSRITAVLPRGPHHTNKGIIPAAAAAWNNSSFTAAVNLGNVSGQISTLAVERSKTNGREKGTR